MVDAVLQATGLPANRLEIEVTETAMLQESDDTLAGMHAIQALGIGIALDDFGTGYSSLSHLRRFPFDRIKIDQTFIRSLGKVDNNSSAIVRAVINLCAELDAAVTAEGVETEEQLTWLQAERSVEVQGYLFSPAVPVSAVPSLIQTLENRGLQVA